MIRYRAASRVAVQDLRRPAGPVFNAGPAARTPFRAISRGIPSHTFISSIENQRRPGIRKPLGFRILGSLFHADVVELADTPDLGSGAARCVGSSPSIRTDSYVSSRSRRLRCRRCCYGAVGTLTGTDHIRSPHDQASQKYSREPGRRYRHIRHVIGCRYPPFPVWSSWQQCP